jgi:hypothetical protein
MLKIGFSRTRKDTLESCPEKLGQNHAHYTRTETIDNLQMMAVSGFDRPAHFRPQCREVGARQKILSLPVAAAPIQG